jgi:hypothetical protein
MFRKSSKQPQLDLFGSSQHLLKGKARDQYTDNQGWHNQFRKEIVSRIDEDLFQVLFDDAMGAPNASISVLVGMMALKEGFGWSDWQLFEQCRFNLLVRSALGLFNITDSVPTESTYYLFRKRLHEHARDQGVDLLQKTFATITQQQIKEFNVNGRHIRMDSKLIGSNSAYFSRYEIIHQVLVTFYKSLSKAQYQRLFAEQLDQLKALTDEEPGKTIYRSTKEEITSRMQALGLLIYKLLPLFCAQDSEAYPLLERVFQEQYKVAEEQTILLRPREEIKADSLQSPHDPDSTFRRKQDQKVKGYNVNLSETIDNDGLNLITDIIVEQAHISDVDFLQPAIEASMQVTDQPVDNLYVDGGYQSPDHDALCPDIDIVYTGIQGSAGRYDLQAGPDGLIVTDTHTGEVHKARLAKKIKTSKEDRWYIDTEQGRIYFSQQAIRTAHLRRQLKKRLKEEIHRRNNVEATIFQLVYHLRNNKSKYRGLIKQKIWVTCRSLWINLVRIINFIKERRSGCGTLCQRPVVNSIMAV